METLPVWKRVYQVIASTNPNVPEDIVDDVLDICKEHISDIFLQYEFYSRESFVRWKQQNVGLKEIINDDEMCNFIHKLSRELDLDTNVAWTVTCNYLMYEYYGKVDELKTLIRFDSKIEYLAENIWYFYTADRMFLLKTLRHILETYDNVTNVNSKKMKSFVQDLNITQLWKNLVKVFYNLTHEIDKDKVHLVPSEILSKWIHRNNREQVEVLLLMLWTLQNFKLVGTELEDTLSLFLKHGFSRHPLYAESTQISRAEDLLQVKNAEIAVVLAILDKYWHSYGITAKLSQIVEKTMELFQIQSDNNIVMFAWLIFKASNSDKMEIDMDRSNTMLTDIFDKKVFVSLSQLLTHRLFEKCKAGDILADAVYTLMVQCTKTCDNVACLHEHDGIGKIMSALLTRKGLMVLDDLGTVFQMAMESFPFAFEPFLDMCKPLLSMPDRYRNMIQFLKAIPTFLAEIVWTNREDQYHLKEVQKLFIDSELFMIPKGTLVEKFTYKTDQFSKFHHPFSFFLLMEQFTKSLNVISFEIGPTWYCYKNLTELVRVGFTFIHHIVKLYKGDYRNDLVLRTLVQRLEIVPIQFCEGPVKNFDFIVLYFSVNCTLIKKGLLDYMEAFPAIQRKKFMPIVTSYSKETRSSLFAQLHNRSLLFNALKEEEGKEKHELLVAYLELILYMVQKDLYHFDVQLAGMWYILNFIFPLHQQWKYEDPHEKVVITKLCFSIFVDILKKHLFKGNGDSLIIFEMVIDSFYYEDITISSYMGVFPRNKFYLTELMERESNWNSGPVLDVIECQKLQLVLLLLLFKHKALIGTPKNVLDDNVGFFARGVTPYIVNPYSLALRKLSCRFLELLSRDQNMPLMALLGLDYDQVQRLYLDRLRDSTEDDDLKVHILDLIGTCVVYQHGMTAAFFNVKRSRKWYCENKEQTFEGDTVTDFMVDYLQNIKKSTNFLRNPLQVGILHVMANLWTSRKKHVIDEVINLDEFWPLLSDPIYQKFDQSPKVYAYIFRIYGIQLLEIQHDRQFLSAVERFVTDKEQVKKWIEYLSLTFKAMKKNIEEIEDRLFLLKSWMEFIIMLEKTKELKKFDAECKFEFILMTLDGVSTPLINTYCFKPWMDLILLQLSHWKLPSTDNSKILAEKAINCVSIIKSFYGSLDQSSRVSVLTIVQFILEKLRTHFQSCSADFMEFVEHFGPMLDHEYKLVEEKKWKNKEEIYDTSVRIQLLPWMLCVRIVSGIFEFKNITVLGCWFVYRRLIDKMMTATCELIEYGPTLPLAKVMLHCLGLYAQSPLYMDFLHANVNHFYLRIEAPITALLSGQNNKINPLQLEEGWLTCSILLKFHTAYFKSLQYRTLPTCYAFITLIEGILKHVFTIVETTVALKALDVVINTLMFFDAILQQWRVEWYRKSNATFCFMLNGIKKIINGCLYAILRPKNIIIYILDESNRFTQMEKYPVELMVDIVNRLVTAVGISFSMLYRINPSLIDLLDESVSDTVVSFVDNDCSVPKFELPISNKLTYGMLLCLAHFLCKTLDALKLNKTKTRSAASPEHYSRCFGMVEHQGLSDNLPTQKLSAFLRYAMYEYTGLADPWIQKLDYNLVKDSLESLMLFLAQQIFLAVTKVAPSDSDSYFKRNLSSELQFFYEHVKKRTSIISNAVGTPQFSPSCRAETDILRRYLFHYKETNRFNEVVDDNFCIVIYFWFTNICKLK